MVQTFSMWLQNSTDLSRCLTIEFSARFERFVSYLVNKAVPLCIPKESYLMIVCPIIVLPASILRIVYFVVFFFFFVITLSWEFVYYVPLKSRDLKKILLLKVGALCLL